MKPAADIDLAVNAENKINREDGTQKKVVIKSHADNRFGLIYIERVCHAGCKDGVNLHVDLEVCQVHGHVVLWQLKVEIQVNRRRANFPNLVECAFDVCDCEIVQSILCKVLGPVREVVECVLEAVFGLANGSTDIEIALGSELCAGLAFDVAFCAYDGDSRWAVIEKRASKLCC